jgi:hypothetical protein
VRDRGDGAVAEFSDDRQVYDVLADLAAQAVDKAKPCGVNAHVVANAAFGTYYAEKQNWATKQTQPVDFRHWFGALSRARIGDIYTVQFTAFKDLLDDRVASQTPAIQLAAVNGQLATIAAGIGTLHKKEPEGFWAHLRGFFGPLGSAIVVNIVATVITIVLLGLFIQWRDIDDRLIERIRADAAVPPRGAVDRRSAKPQGAPPPPPPAVAANRSDP